MATWGNRDTVVYLVAELVSDSDQRVIVKTTEDRIGAKRRAIQSDIRDQKFARWAPFAGAVINQDYTIRLFNQDMTPYN
jgi:hypothetical protein